MPRSIRGKRYFKNCTKTGHDTGNRSRGRRSSAIETELEQEYAIIEGFPEDAIDLTIDVNIFQDGEIQKVCTTKDMRELADAIKETKDWYCPGLMDMPFDEVDNYEPVSNCVVLSLPVNSVFVKLSGNVYRNNRLEPFYISLDLSDLRRAFQLAADDYIPSDAVFCLTEKGKEFAKSIEEKHG